MLRYSSSAWASQAPNIKYKILKTTFDNRGGNFILSKRKPISSHQISSWSNKPSYHGHVTIVSQKAFHTSQQRNIHPIFWLAVRPLIKVGSMITGRIARKWWGKLSPEQKSSHKKRLFEARYKFAAVGGLLLTAFGINIATHIQETPITKRKRYIAFTPEQFQKIVQFEVENQMETWKNKIVNPKHPVYERVISVAQKLVDSNQDLEFFTKQKWTVIVVDSPEENAFVIPTGHIFVFTGLMKIANTPDSLGIILGHEMSHALLSHGAETISFAAILDWVVIIVMAGIWFFMPNDGIALVTQWFYNKVMDLMLHLPYSRKLEEEADLVGLQLAAKACFDVRESIAFWELMDIKYDAREEIPPPQFLSTHPSNKTRIAKLNELMKKAEELRLKCNCHKLPATDPRDGIQYFKQLVKEEIAKKKAKVDSEIGVEVKPKLDVKNTEVVVGTAAAALTATKT